MFQYYSAFLDFLAKIVGSLAWPVLVYFLVRIFRQQVGGVVTTISVILARLRELRGFGGHIILDGGSVDSLDTSRKFEVLPPPEK